MASWYVTGEERSLDLRDSDVGDEQKTLLVDWRVVKLRGHSPRLLLYSLATSGTPFRGKSLVGTRPRFFLEWQVQ